MRAFFIFILIFSAIYSVSQQKFVGGKFCETGATSYESHSIFDSLGNCFFIGSRFGLRYYDTFDLKNNEGGFTTWYGRWKYLPKIHQVAIKMHDSIPLVQIIDSPSTNQKGKISFKAIDYYGVKINDFRIFIFISDSIVVPINSDSLTGILSFNKFEFQKIIIPGMDTAISSTSISGNYILKYTVPAPLVYKLRPINNHYERHRTEITEHILIWRKSQLLPNGKYWLYLCDF